MERDVGKTNHDTPLQPTKKPTLGWRAKKPIFIQDSNERGWGFIDPDSVAHLRFHMQRHEIRCFICRSWDPRPITRIERVSQ